MCSATRPRPARPPLHSPGAPGVTLDALAVVVHALEQWVADTADNHLTRGRTIIALAVIERLGEQVASEESYLSHPSQLRAVR